MRRGKREEKFTGAKIDYKRHRIIIPVYIPNNTGYYQSLDDILYLHLNSLYKTIDPKKTLITVINNNSHKRTYDFLKNEFEEGRIDKLVNYAENRGKVLPLVSEIHASSEDFITYADCDVLFLTGWLNDTFRIFQHFPYAGAVTPYNMPHISSIANLSAYLIGFFGIKRREWNEKEIRMLYDSFEIDYDRYYKQLKGRYVYLKKDGVEAALGSTHVVSTVKRTCYRLLYSSRPEYVFANKMDQDFLDRPIDISGRTRCSTIKKRAIHMGNTLDENYKKMLCTVEFKDYEIPALDTRSFYLVRRLFPRNSDKLAALLRKLHI